MSRDALWMLCESVCEYLKMCASVKTKPSSFHVAKVICEVKHFVARDENSLSIFIHTRKYIHKQWVHVLDSLDCCPDPPYIENVWCIIRHHKENSYGDNGLIILSDSLLWFEPHIKSIFKSAFCPSLQYITHPPLLFSCSSWETWSMLLLLFSWIMEILCSMGFPPSHYASLQIVQNSVAQILTCTKMYEHITPLLEKLHWLPISMCIQ